MNCGYDASHTYGLLYQFGRKVGGGYNSTEGMQEATEASNSYDSDGYNKNPDDKKLYILSAQEDHPYDWYTNKYNNLLSAWPMKSTDAGYVEGKIGNPCPTGWCIPTYDQLNALTGNNGGKSIGTNGWDSTNKGYWFNGTTSPVNGNGLFLPAAGYRRSDNGSASSRGYESFYWSSSVTSPSGWTLCFNSESAYMIGSFRARSTSVRCVKE